MTELPREVGERLVGVGHLDGVIAFRHGFAFFAVGAHEFVREAERRGTSALRRTCKDTFLSFLRVYQDLPSIEGILLEPTNAKVPTTVGARWAVSSSLVKRASQDNLPRILTYMGRLSSSAGSRDFEIMTVKDILKVNAAATQCAAFGEWAARNDDVMS